MFQAQAPALRNSCYDYICVFDITESANEVPAVLNSILFVN